MLLLLLVSACLVVVCIKRKAHLCATLCTQARHTGIKIVQQIAILLGCAVLPHLKALVDIIKHGLTDENQKVCIAGLLRTFNCSRQLHRSLGIALSDD